jgi:hypothetical protein
MATAKKNPTSTRTAKKQKDANASPKASSFLGFLSSGPRSGPTNPPYEAELLNGETTEGNSGKVPFAILGQDNARGLETLEKLRATYGDKLYPPSTQDASQPNTNTTVASEIIIKDQNPTDSRLVFAINETTGAVVYSMSAQNEHPLIDGMVVAKDPMNKNSPKVTDKDLTDDEAQRFTDFFGVPAIMNTNAYINLQAAGGKINNKYIIDRENEIRWYNVTEPYGAGVQGSSAPTVNEIVNWSLDEANRYKFPYRFTDFAFCKFWQKIPNNYLITLRRYPFPVNDSVTSGEEARGELKKKNLKPVATMLTFLGEDSGNKMSTILGPIETGLKWKDIKADVWQVTTNEETAGGVNNPAPAAAKFLGFLSGGAAATKTRQADKPPPDPYENGPYANKIIGPVNVIDSTKGRERGLEFKHEVSLVFEYSLRSIGGINTKAAGLDIIANCMLMTSATAPFWGGMNRFMPFAGGGTHDPFLGGDSGKAAWMRGDPEGFMKSLKTQFTKAFNNVSDLFNKVFSDPVGGLQQIAAGGAKEFMKATTTDAKTQLTGLHSLLTGAPVGEWHITIGPPMNPMMMMGNMICKSGKLEFNDELGPDDFPTEIKFTVNLEHGMPRDKDAIESMFNKGRGRIYALPKGYEKSFSSSSQSQVDTSYKRNTVAGKNNKVSPNNASVERDRAYDAAATNKAPIVGSPYAALYSNGSGYVPGISDAADEKRKNAKK